MNKFPGPLNVYSLTLLLDIQYNRGSVKLLAAKIFYGKKSGQKRDFSWTFTKSRHFFYLFHIQ